MMTTAALLKTPLHAWHAANGGKLTPFAGWDMPLQYQRVATEHTAVRTAAGLFDVSHMGIIHVVGGTSDEVRHWLDTMLPQDIGAMQPGQAVYTQLLNEQGGILDDLIVYRPAVQGDGCFAAFSPYFIICNASNVSTNLEWLTKHAPAGLTPTEVTDVALFALQGPKFTEVLAKLGLTDLPGRFHMGWGHLMVGGKAIGIGVSRTGYTGEDGVELMIPAEHAEAVWQGLLTAGEPFGLLPIGLAARDTLRLEAAYPLHGQDITPQATPLEGGLGWSLRLDKPMDFMGKQALLAQQDAGIPQRFVCLQLDGKAIARSHTAILDATTSKPIGEITSGTLVPNWGGGAGDTSIAMGYIQADALPAMGETVVIDIRGKHITATRVKRPFYSGVTS